MMFYSTSLEETNTYAQMVGACIQKRGSTPFVLGFCGNLGSGKTTLVQYLARHFGCKERVTSPTFIFMNEYPISLPPFDVFVHIDAYRCEDPSDLSTTGISAACVRKGALVCVEWFENMEGACRVDEVITCTTEGEKYCFEDSFVYE